MLSEQNISQLILPSVKFAEKIHHKIIAVIQFGVKKLGVKDEKIAVGGWTETTQIELMPFVLNYMSLGITKVICTDISKDGMLQGPAIELYKKMISQAPEMYLIASGGVSSINDIDFE